MGHLEPVNTTAAGKEATKLEAGKREVDITRETLKYKSKSTEAKKIEQEKSPRNLPLTQSHSQS